MHAAHERIVMEKLKLSLDAGAVARQSLLVPAVLSVDALDIATAEENSDALEKLGLETSVSGPNELAVRAAPALLAGGDIAGLTREPAARTSATTARARCSSARQNELLATMACHAAVRANRVAHRDRDERAAARDGGNRALRQLQPRPPDLVPADAWRTWTACSCAGNEARMKRAGVMIVTGGGRGIGAATARLAAKRGYAVCVNYLRDRTSAEARGAGHPRRRRHARSRCRATSPSEKDVVHLFARMRPLARRR